MPTRPAQPGEPSHEWARSAGIHPAGLQALIDELPLAIFLKDGTGRYMAVNRVFAELVDRPVTDILGRTEDDLLASHIVTSPNAVDGRSEGDGRGPDAPVESLSFGATGHSVMFRKSALRGPTGCAVGVLGVGIDFTSRMKAADALQESEELYHALVNIISDGFIVTDGKRILDANERVAGLFLRALPDLVGRPLDDVVAPGDRERVARAIECGSGDKVGLSGLRGDGSTIDAEAYIAQVHHRGRAARIIGIRDISASKQAEELLKTQHGLSMVLSETVELGETLFICMKTAMAVSGMDVGAIFLLDEDAFGYAVTYYEGMDFSRFKNIPPRVLMHGDAEIGPVTVPVYPRIEELDPTDAEVCRSEGIRSLAVLPVRHGGSTLACIVVASRTHDGVNAPSRRALEVVSDQIGVFIQRVSREEAHRESEVRYRRLFEHSPLPIVVLDSLVDDGGTTVDFTVVDLNPAFEALAGLKYGDAVGERVAGLMMREVSIEPLFRTFLRAARERRGVARTPETLCLAGGLTIAMVPLFKGQVACVFSRAASGVPHPDGE